MKYLSLCKTVRSYNIASSHLFSRLNKAWSFILSSQDECSSSLPFWSSTVFRVAQENYKPWLNGKVVSGVRKQKLQKQEVSGGEKQQRNTSQVMHTAWESRPAPVIEMLCVRTQGEAGERWHCGRNILQSTKLGSESGCHILWTNSERLQIGYLHFMQSFNLWHLMEGQ